MADRLPDDLKRDMERQLSSALSRFADRVGVIDVTVNDLSWRGGAADKECRVRIQILPSGFWIIQESRLKNIYTVVNYAANRIARMLHRQFERDEQLKVPRAHNRGGQRTKRYGRAA
jgi:ribosome-associated translation inhibitor RaiA